MTDAFFTLDTGEPMGSLPADTGQYSDMISAHMVEFSRLAYAGQSEVAAQLKARGFVKLSFFRSDATFGWLAEHPGSASRKPFSVVAFRGTERYYADIVTDLSVFKRPIADSKYRVHGGFLTALNVVWGSQHSPAGDDTFKITHYGSKGLIHALMQTTYEADIYFTGHSMGGALADLAAYKLQLQLDSLIKAGTEVSGITALYSYGAPRTMGRKLAKSLDDRQPFQYYRVMNGADLVPRTPIMGFQHWGESITLRHNGERVKNMPIINAFFLIWLKQLLVFVVLFALIQLGMEKVEDLKLYSDMFGRTTQEPWLSNVVGVVVCLVMYGVVFIFAPKLIALLPGDMSRWWGNKLVSDHLSKNYRKKLMVLAQTTPDPQVKSEPVIET
ncbi:MAG: hypothetical protein ACI8WB_000059 [Phenylobacterium sp.]|jgi:hypothetical protein